MEAALVTIQRVFPSVLRMSISASWLVLAAVALRLALRRAPKWWRCLLWILVAVRLVCPVLPESPVSMMPQVGASASAEDKTLIDVIDGNLPDLEFETPRDRAINNVAERSGQNARIGSSASPSEYLPFVWMGGMIAMLLYALAGYLRLRRRVAASIPLGENVLLCDEIDSPFILGVFRPRIYVPSRLAEPQLSHVLAHERAHLARHDHWWKPLGFLLLSVYWFNPVLWLANILLCRDIELACDERVYRDMALSERAGYSQALLDCSRSRRVLAACPLAFVEVSVKERVKAALRYKKPAFWVTVVAVVACAIAAVCFLTNPAKLAIGFSRDEIIEAETYHIMTVEDAGLRRLSGEELDILYERLRAIPNAARRGGYAGLTPMYTLSFNIPYKGSFQLRGYNDEGTMTEIYYEHWNYADGMMHKNETWLVKDNDFGRYVMELCKYGAGQVDDLDGFLLVLKDANSISYDPPAISSTAYPFPITDPELLAEVKSVLEQAVKTDGGPLQPNDAAYLISGSFSLDGTHTRKFYVSDGYLCEYDEVREKTIVLGRMPEGVNLNRVMENALRGQSMRGGAEYAPDSTTVETENTLQPTDFLVVEYDADLLSPDDIDALGAKHGFTAVHNFGRGDLLTAQFGEVLTAERANEIASLLSAEPGIHFAGRLASPIMGFAYHYSDEEIVPNHFMRSYYTYLNNENVKIAESFGFTIDDHIVAKRPFIAYKCILVLAAV